MNKHIKTLSLFLILLFIFLAITTVSATDANESSIVTTVSEDSSTDSVVLTENFNEKSYDNDDLKYESYETKEIIKKDINVTENKNALPSKLTVGSAEKVNVGTTMSIYGKLSSNGVDIPYKQITVTVDGAKYTVNTTKYGNYNFKITPSSEGIKTITANFAGTNTYSSATATSKFTVNKIITEITVGCRNSTYTGDKFSIYGKLTANGKNLPNQQIEIQVEDDYYFATTTKYGNYNINVTAYYEGYNTVYVAYYGSNIYKSDSASTFIQVSRPTIITVGCTASVYVDGKVCIYGKLTSKGVNQASKRIYIRVDEQDYYATTTKYGNYNLNITAKNAGYNEITASYYNSNSYYSDSASTSFYAYKKTGAITVGCTKDVYVGDKVCIYGKLTANGKNVPYEKIKINIGDTNYYATTTKYGNYNINITSVNIGSNTVNANFDGSYAVSSDSASTYFNVNKKNTVITIGCTQSISLGKEMSVYGKLTANGKDLAYKTVYLDVMGDIYTVTTSQYGNYKIELYIYDPSYKQITATYDGDEYTLSSSASTTFTTKYPTLELYLYKIKNGYPQETIQVGPDQFQAWYQTYDGQYDKGAYVEAIGYDPYTDTYSPPHYYIEDAIFFFINDEGDYLIEEYTEKYWMSSMKHDLVYGYTPYKVIVSYRKATAYERNHW